MALSGHFTTITFGVSATTLSTTGIVFLAYNAFTAPAGVSDSSVTRWRGYD